jgi:hypothetical protein
MNPVSALNGEGRLLHADKPGHFGGLRYALTIFLAAALLFQVELVLGKFVLPWFGGVPATWSTCLLVFQGLLLAGYGYAYWNARLAPGRARIVHLVVLACAGLSLVAVTATWGSPLLPPASWRPRSGVSPVWQIAKVLLATVGLPAVVLAATSPLLQYWQSRETDGGSPYRLYALSNLGSLVGLLTFPFVVERLFSLHRIAWLWAGAYVVFLAAAAVAAWCQPVAELSSASPVSTCGAKVDSHRKDPWLLWFLLPACGSAMLLATTNELCQEIAVIPLLWVLPLSLYLLTFMLAFDHPRWFRRGVWYPLFAASAGAAFWLLAQTEQVENLALLGLAIFPPILFSVCMICHGELARLRPERDKLTVFYLAIASGGLLGSAFVVLAAPLLFTTYWEFQLAVVACAALAWCALLRDPQSWVRRRVLLRYIAVAASVVLVWGAWVSRVDKQSEPYIALRSRNFFGVKSVLHDAQGWWLRHGSTLHGMQYEGPRHPEPTLYYKRESGVGLLLANYPRAQEADGSASPLRIGVVGLGAGTLAAYAQPHDYYRFYEIDPGILPLSSGNPPTFSFLNDAPGRVDIVEGDARIAMRQELDEHNPQNFDVLVLDAFSSDAIPVHLLTREAMELYRKELRGRASVIAFHVTNRSLDLRPVVAALCGPAGFTTIEVHPTGAGDWILASQNPAMLETPSLKAIAMPVIEKPGFRPWTDDYSNLFAVVK